MKRSFGGTMYKDMEDKKLRELTPQEVCAMYHFHNEYARRGVGAIGFYKQLSEHDKEFIDRMTREILKHSRG
jgi:hypothetical protein